MKKIIAAFDELRFSESTLEEAVRLAKLHKAHLVGVFLHEFTASGYIVYEALVSQSGSGRERLEALEKDDASTGQASIDTFEAACQEEGLPYSIHRDKRSALKELLHESIFADLLIIDPGETFSYIEEERPGWFMKSLLHEAHCPVWIVAKQQETIHELVFLYDGSPSSMHAIKIFTYLFPEMSGKEVLVLSVKTGSLNLHVPDNKLIHEWVKRHYPRANYKVVQGEPSRLVEICREKGPEVLVLAGAYERSKLSTWLHPSLSDELMRETKSPLFITHI